MGAIYKTLEEGIQAKIDDAIDDIKFWLKEGYSLTYAINRFNESTNFGPDSKRKVLSQFINEEGNSI